jgi:hypothetical protein
LNGVAMPFFFNMFMTISGNWFNMQERIFASGLFLFSLSLGFAASQWSFKYQYGPTYFDDSNLGLGLSNLVLLVVCSIVFKSKPDACPSRSQTVYRRVEYDFIRDINLLK